MQRSQLIEDIAKSIDAKDAKKFSEYITEDGTFRFGNAEPVKGRKNIEDYVAYFFTMIKSSEHKIVQLWDEGNNIIWQGEVRYTRLDERKVTVSFVNIFNMKEDMITDYLIYIDNTPLFAE
ncbi:MAG: nuclear transport factor 2 family protein [Ignavibacteria bacterium]|nr:nuclear transport factor 2 family protein [Ignavibacteria bacterium]MBK9404538.1 nuclear transport factor 2 family protein [Ignavibacteria bacterium]MBL0108662.1 nuclear transport factor 2 family protein [Ignavibacteria bacterium]